MARLNLAALAALPASVARPAYDVASVETGIVHLGLGAFHRAHQAVYTDAILGADPRWGICGVSLKTPRSTVALAEQDGLYSVLWKSAEGVRAQVVGALRECLFAGARREEVLLRMADPRILVLTTTVTEKGYCHDPATGELDRAHPDIVHDLANPRSPVSAVGMLVAGLAARRDAGGGALNLVCCDNLPANGRTVERIVLAFARERDRSLAEWIAEHVGFPCTMVDRIVPATTAADIEEAARRIGADDAVPVASEPFGQWVIENRFACSRPAWEHAGAQIVADVAPYETMKLRLLNGAHSTLAYLGFLMGHQTVWQAASDPLLGDLIERMMRDEVAPTLAAPPGIDLVRYGAELRSRFRNPALPHRTQQIAMDGSQKLPQRLLGTIRDRIAVGSSYACLALAVAAWIRYASGTDEHGVPIAVSDPLADRFATLSANHFGDPVSLADAFLDLAPVFGADLSAHAGFRTAVRERVVQLFRAGVRRTVAAHLDEIPSRRP